MLCVDNLFICGIVFLFLNRLSLYYCFLKINCVCILIVYPSVNFYLKNSFIKRTVNIKKAFVILLQHPFSKPPAITDYNMKDNHI